MKASGLFHLTARVSQAVLTSPTDGTVRGWRFELIERYGDHSEHHVTGYWRGPFADDFVVKHWADLKAGTSLNLELERVHAVDGQLRARIVGAELAPVRWPGRSRAAAVALAQAADRLASTRIHHSRSTAA